jgi:hypothetical protein
VLDVASPNEYVPLPPTATPRSNSTHVPTVVGPAEAIGWLPNAGAFDHVIDVSLHWPATG